MTDMRRHVGPAAVLTFLLAVAGGCSDDPSQGFTVKSQYPTDVKTVAVPIWRKGHDEYRRDIEMRITEALVKRILLETPYRIADRSRADTELTGELVDVKQTPLSFDPRTGTAREFQIRLVVDFTWRDLRTGRNRVERRNFTAASSFVPSFGHDFFQGSEDAVNRLAERVVHEMAADW